MKTVFTPAALIVAGAGALAGSLVTLGVVRWTGPQDHVGSDRAADVHQMGHTVMPFALEQTTHVFEMTTTGGIQDVVAKDPADSAQIRLIRQHLSHEASQFKSGDYSDPMSLHGRDMPGVSQLSAAGGRLEVEYQDLPAGARITFVATDPELITAIHRWFGAQLSDHGADATYR
jgi:hypothetical protein